MKTDDLIDMLAAGADTPPSRRTGFLPLLAGGLLASFALLLVLLGVRPNLLEELTWPAFWSKLVFSLALAAAGWVAVRRLSIPGARTNALPFYLGAPVLAIWLTSAVVLSQAAPETRAALFWGSTWRYCPVLIALISIPLFASMLAIMRSRTPTRLRTAGAAAGFAAGAAAAAVYCLHCPELSIVFVGFWYLLGMLIPAAVGALIGPRVLAW
ncbi:hypothetical protein SAMN05216319_1061 [Duganella sp. CF402]|uniref:NrsF family protein n=1 Tax=unclassified Duganella TaxID=2636909 RepID=UPI0008BA237A|nr:MULTISPECIES: DUF1109 domain-containing protein [unclassified Duganella]RZT10481.1 hypothetical protein EV582_2565 [Duganella sp. BK701]SEL11276.1 hypothetical protein SAMN05216319_1061 [Duganella sp. CF402]